jgi:hypothetical protein
VRFAVARQPLDASSGEITAKGYVNQRIVRERRPSAINALYDDPTAA